MNTFAFVAVCAVLGVANAGLIGSGLVSPLGVRSITAPGIGSTVVAGPSGTILSSATSGLSSELGLLRTSSGLIDNSGLVSGVSPVIAARSLPLAGGLALNSVLGLGLVNSGIHAPLIARSGLIASPGLIANSGLIHSGLIANSGLINSGLIARNGLIDNSGLIGRSGLIDNSGLIANQWW